MARLAALVPRPRANLTRFHGVFAPSSKYRALVTPSKRGKSAKRQINGHERSPVEQHAAMTWAQRLKRVFNIDIWICEACGGAVKVISRIEDPLVIKQILAHLQRKAESKGSLTAAHYNFLSVSCVPFAEARTAIFRVCFGENRLSPGRIRLPSCAHKRHCKAMLSTILIFFLYTFTN